MGIYRSSYLGPWLLIKVVPQDVVIKNTIKCCISPTCTKKEVKSNGKFCDACGKELGSKTNETIKKQAINLWDLFDDNDLDIDDFWWINSEFSNVPDNCEVLAENSSGYLHNLGLPKIDDESLYVEFENMDIPLFKEAFVKKHVKVIEILSNKLGVENVQVKFGVLDNYS